DRFARREQADQIEERNAVEEWERTAKRQAEADKILTRLPPTRRTEAVVNGQPLTVVLHNEKTIDTHGLSLDDLVLLRPIVTGDEPETITFDVPIAFDVLTNAGALHLLVDPPAEDENEDLEGGFPECTRAANGNCLLTWKTLYEAPGKHALQMKLVL